MYYHCFENGASSFASLDEVRRDYLASPPSNCEERRSSEKPRVFPGFTDRSVGSDGFSNGLYCESDSDYADYPSACSSSRGYFDFDSIDKCSIHSPEASFSGSSCVTLSFLNENCFKIVQ